MRSDGRIDVVKGLAWIETDLDPARRYTGGAPSATTCTVTLAEAKRLHEIVKVQRAWLAFEREQSKLIDADEARRTVFARGRAERDAHLAWVQRIAPLAGGRARRRSPRNLRRPRMMREHLEYLADLPLGSFGDSI